VATPREPREVPIKQGSGIRKSGRVFGQGQKTAKMVRAGLYARVSTQDQQTLPMQNRAMREYAARRGWTVTMQIKEVGSGASQRADAGKPDGSSASPGKSMWYWCGGWTDGADQ